MNQTTHGRCTTVNPPCADKHDEHNAQVRNRAESGLKYRPQRSDMNAMLSQLLGLGVESHTLGLFAPEQFDDERSVKTLVCNGGNLADRCLLSCRWFLDLVGVHPVQADRDGEDRKGQQREYRVDDEHDDRREHRHEEGRECERQRV